MKPITDNKEVLQDKCPTCGGNVNVSWSGLELVQNTGDETLASKHYTTIPSFNEIEFERLEDKNQKLLDSNRELLEALKDIYRWETVIKSGNATSWKVEILKSMRKTQIAIANAKTII